MPRRLLPLILLLLFARPVAARIEAGAPLPFDGRTRLERLDNGLTYYIRENREPRDRAELRLVVNAGSILEDDDQRGLAHFLEHMAFNGTENFSGNEIIDYMERIGMEFGPEVNAYTSYDETVYMLTVPTDDAAILDTAFQILREWAGSLTLDPQEIDKERGVVVEEWRLRQGAAQRVQEEQRKVLYHDSRYADRDPIGSMEVIENFAPETLRRFYRQWYRPSLMAVVAVGDFQADEIEYRIRRLFADLQDPVDAPARFESPVPGHPQTLFSVVSDPELTASRVQVLRKSPPEVLETVDDYRGNLLEGLWYRMLNARLSERTTQADPPYVAAFAGRQSLARTADAGTLTALVREDDVLGGLRAALEEMARADDSGFTESELEREKARRMSALQRQYNEREKTPSARYAASRAAHFLQGSPVMGIANILQLNEDLLPEITVEDVNQAGLDLFQRANRVVLVSLPEKEGVSVPTEDELRALLAEVSGSELEAYQDTVSDEPLVSDPPEGGRIVQREHDADLDLYQWTLGNGVRVFLKPTDFRDDEILFSGYSPGGSALYPAAEYWDAALANIIVGAMGLGAFDPVQLQKKLAGRQVSLRPYIGEMEEGLQGSSTPADLETLLKLNYLYFTGARKDSTYFSSLMERWGAMLANRSASPEQVFADTLQVTLSQHNPRSVPLTLQRLESVDLDETYRIFTDRFGDATDFTFVLVGSFDPAEIEPLLIRWLGGLPSGGRVESMPDPGIEAPGGVVSRAVRRGEEPKARTAIVFHGPFQWDRSHRHALSTLASCLEIRLREILREELSGTYGVSVNEQRVLFPEPRYQLRIDFGADPDRLGSLSEQVFTTLEEMREMGPTEDEMAKVKEQQRRQYEEGLRRNGAWMAFIGFRDRHGIDQRELLDTPEVIDSITAEQVREGALDWLDLDRYVQVSLFPQP